MDNKQIKPRFFNTDKVISISSDNELDENMINQIKLNFINQIQNQLYFGNNIIQASEKNNINFCIKKQKFKKQYLKKKF